MHESVVASHSELARVVRNLATLRRAVRAQTIARRGIASLRCSQRDSEPAAEADLQPLGPLEFLKLTHIPHELKSAEESRLTLLAQQMCEAHYDLDLFEV